MKMFTKRVNRNAIKISKKEAKSAITEPNLPTEEVKSSTFKDSLKKLLPVALSNSLVEKKPNNIYRISASRGTYAVAWNDADGLKLYLEPYGTVNPSELTYHDIQPLAKIGKWKQPLPDTILVKLTSASGPEPMKFYQSWMSAKEMVLGWSEGYQQDSKLFHPPVLKEMTKTDNPERAEFIITFSVKGIIQKQPIMSIDVSSIIADQVQKPLSLLLENYQQSLSKGVVNGFRVEQGNTIETKKMLKDITDAAADLRGNLANWIANWKSIGIEKTHMEILKTLGMTVASASNDNFKDELDTERWKLWLNIEPLTEDNIVPGTKTLLGKGAQGPVFKYVLDPALGRSPVVLKYDSDGLNQDAMAAGIPKLNPQQSTRAMATFNISERLELKIIPQTTFFVGTDVNGRPKLGQAMDVVNGTVGQRKAGIKFERLTDQKSQELNGFYDEYITLGRKDNLTEEEIQRRQMSYNVIQQYYHDGHGNWYPTSPIDQNKVQTLESQEVILNNPDNYSEEDVQSAGDTLKNYLKVGNEWHFAQIIPADIAYTNPIVQKGLSDLQVFDCIIGHADRNAGNWIYEKDENGIIGVKGIDNDDTFGKDWKQMQPSIPGKYAEWSSKTLGVPPIVDVNTALSILQTNFEDIRPLLAGLSPEEINKASERFQQVQEEVKQRVRDESIATTVSNFEDIRPKVVLLVGFVDKGGIDIFQWGNIDVTSHTVQNSYLGTQLAQKNDIATASGNGVVFIEPQ